MSISEDANYEDVYWKHNEGTLDSNHKLLPGKLKLTWKQRRCETSLENKNNLWIFSDVIKIRFTQVHDLLRGVCGDPIEHDAGQHGAEQQGETTGHPLYTSKGAAWWSINHRVPEVSIIEILYRLHEEQITGRWKQPFKS